MIYFDYNATTPVDEAVFEAMSPFFCQIYGNASSLHQSGRRARAALDEARHKVAMVFNVHPKQVVFTSGGTESNNLALKGLSALLPASQLIVSPIEHASVRVPAHELAWAGWKLLMPRVNEAGLVDLEDLERMLKQKSGLISVMLANNETGVLQPVSEIARLGKKFGAFVHTDAVQAFGKISVDFNSLGVDALSIAGHKIYGPKGVGALIVREGIDLMPVLTGGSQERGLRAGTENVAAIVGFAEASKLAVENLSLTNRLGEYRDQLENGVLALGGQIFGKGSPRVANTSYFAFEGIDGPKLASRLNDFGFCVATGSACSSGKTEPSSVLGAMGISESLARGAIRVSFGKQNIKSDVEKLLSVMTQCLLTMGMDTACI
ncbi:MAG: cysteine desulfurase [Proteobacteria bacterium]|nr:cysteine desulfurase [Pseudomonadota bacterium]